MILSTIDAFWAAFRPAWRVALWAFIGIFGSAVIGFLNAVGQWASAHGQTPFPDVSTLGYAFVAGGVALGTSLFVFLIRFGQAKGLLPGQPPIYPSSSSPLPDDPRSSLVDQTGAARLATLAVALALLVGTILLT